MLLPSLGGPSCAVVLILGHKDGIYLLVPALIAVLVGES
jgi:hypothetical protein